MVVIATPTSHPVVQCCDTSNTPQVLNAVPWLNVFPNKAPVSASNGQPVLTRTRAITIKQGEYAEIVWQMHDQNGVPLNLSGLGDGMGPGDDIKVVLRLKEQIALGNSNPVAEFDASISNAAEGMVSVTLLPNATGLAGIYYAEFALVYVPASDSDPLGPATAMFSNTCSLIITRGTFESYGRPGGPPSIAEVRLHLRDSGPSESYLLENLMFDDAEIALATTRPVMYWNEIPPPLSPMYNTQTFPYRYHWLEGICANLFMMVAEQYRRNQLDYQAGGMAVNDQNKEANYERAGQARWQAYREWVRATKASINLEGCYGEVTSNYKYSAYTDAIRIRY
jgi:hypothetical protein